MKKTLEIVAIALLLVAICIPAKAQSDADNLSPKTELRLPDYDIDIFFCNLNTHISSLNTNLHLPDYDNKTFHFGFLFAFSDFTYALKTIKDYSSIAHPTNSWPTGFPYWYSLYDTHNLYVLNVEPMLTPGTTFGITSNLRLGRHFNFRFIPSLSFADRRIHYTLGIEDYNGNITKVDFFRSIMSTFVEFPINIKYRIFRHNNIGPYLMGGINPKIDLSRQKDNEEIDYQGNEFINNFVTKRYDCAAEFGVGLDLYAKRVKVGIEVKLSEGLLDIVEAPAFIYTAPIEQLRNRMFQVSVLVE